MSGRILSGHEKGGEVKLTAFTNSFYCKFYSKVFEYFLYFALS